MGRRNTDGFEKLGHEMETVSRSVQELAVLGNLIYTMLVPGGTTEGNKTNLL